MRAGFEFSAQPKPVKSHSKYRDPGSNRPSDYGRMTNDPRVQPNNPSNTGEYSNTKGSARSGGKGPEGSHREENNLQPMYAPLTERKIQNEADLVPDYYVDRPPTPEYKPLPPGVEVATQVEDHELFDFQLEVQPILQVLVGKTLEQSQLELREEDEKIQEARHKMLFEKVRNAELMVTQRKEAAHIRKQEEKARREKQYKIEKEDKAVAHRKYISRLLAKHVTFGIGGDSIRTLADQDVLNYNLKTEMNKEYLPVLIINALEQTNTYYSTEEIVRYIRGTVEHQSSTVHAHYVKVEMDRRQKIIDDAEAERVRLEAARKRRRERRRKLRIYVDKIALLEKIQTNIVAKAIEAEGPFAVDITDVFPIGKESLATIGGLFGELWLIINTFQVEHPIDIRIEQLTQVFVTLLNDRPKSKDINIYLNQDYQALIQDTLNFMNDDLIHFNQSKHERIDEIAAQLEDLNFFQNLGILYDQKLLDQSIFNKLNKALLYLFFTSVDYKIPEKRPRKMTAGSMNEPAQPNEQPNEQPETTETKPAEGEILAELHEEGKTKEPEEEEEVKIPEVTPFEQAAVLAKKRVKLNFVADWEFRRECDAVIRFRIPLVREIELSKSEVKSETEQIEKAAEEHVEKVETKKEPKEKKIEKVPVAPVRIEETETLVERKERLGSLVENDEPIEPFDGSGFEKEKLEFREMDIAGHPLKIYNQSLVEGKYMAQINEVAQKRLRREIIELIKESVPEWKETNDERILVKAEEKYRKYEKVVIDSLLDDPEQVPIYDIENI